MNIFGEGFPKEITDQISVRQKAYGSGYAKGTSRTPDEISFLNANTSWCKLMSSVFIRDPKLINSQNVKQLTLENGLVGNGLAQKYVLFNGTSEYNGGNMFSRSGITESNLLSGGDSAYGIGGTEFGLRPMMGIQSISVSHENRGSLRRAEVKLKAFNKTQFEIIDILYLRLGFSVLLEWGNTMYFDNKGILQKNSNNSLDNVFLNGAGNYDVLLKQIHDQRLLTNGNYDAMFAKVTNFHWSFIPDGSYDITISLSSIGDIIESLKINTLLETDGTFISIKDEQEKSASTEELSTVDLIDLYASKHTIGSFLYFLKFQLADVKEETNPKSSWIPDVAFDISNLLSPLPENLSAGVRFKVTVPEKANSYYTSIPIINSQIQKNQNKFIEEYNNQNLKISSTLFDKGHRDAVSIKWDNYKDEWQYYVRLGTLLQFIQNVIMIQVSNDNNNFIPGLKFDFESGTNLMYVDPLQISVDPRICVVNKTLQMLDSSTTYNLFSIESKIDNANFVYAPGCEPFIFQDIKSSIPNTDYGDIMNIYLNFTFILNKIDELKDDKNKVSLIDFLQGILQGVNTALGGINDLDVFIDETTNTVKIIDKNPLPNLDKVINYYKDKGIQYKSIENSSLSTEPAYFELYGYNGNNGTAGFIKDFSFTTELTPEFSTIITVGAAANGTVVGENDTALSKLNKGLEDRYKNTVTNGSFSESNNISNISTSISSSKEYEELSNKLGKIYFEYTTFLKTLSPTKSSNYDTLQELNVEEIDTYKDTLTNIIQLKQQIVKVKERINNLNNPQQSNTASPSTGFIPFNLSLTMDGISGMKINQQFTIDTSYLPSNYPNVVKFLIKNISHEVSNNKWYTKLESYCIASGVLDENTSPNLTSTGQNSDVTSQPIIIPSNNKVGALPYDNSDLAKYIKSLGKQNGLLNINDSSVLQKLTFLPPSANKIYYPDGYWRLHPIAAKSYISFYNSAKAAGFNWTLGSAYRSRQHQSNLGSGNTVSSPGSSPHGWAGAFDVSELYQAVGGSGAPYVNSLVRQNNPLYKWMSENGPKFGWYNPYRLSDGNGVDECWHWEYWGSI